MWFIQLAESVGKNPPARGALENRKLDTSLVLLTLLLRLPKLSFMDCPPVHWKALWCAMDGGKSQTYWNHAHLRTARGGASTTFFGAAKVGCGINKNSWAKGSPAALKEIRYKGWSKPNSNSTGPPPNVRREWFFLDFRFPTLQIKARRADLLLRDIASLLLGAGANVGTSAATVGVWSLLSFDIIVWVSCRTINNIFIKYQYSYPGFQTQSLNFSKNRIFLTCQIQILNNLQGPPLLTDW